MTKTLSNLFVLSALTLLALGILLPETANAQGFVPCNGPDCTACHLVAMGDTILNWLIGILFLVFAVTAFIAGWGLVTSGGNATALSAAKEKMTGALIGLILVLAAWLIVDTILMALLDGNNDGTPDGNIIGFGTPWSEVQCGSQVTPATVTATSPEDAATMAIDTFGAVGDYGSSTAGLGTGKDAIVDFAEAMDALNCQYSQANRNACRGTPAYTDCSDLVNAAYQAAGCSSPGTYTGNMIANAKPFSSQSELRAGDAMIHRTGGAGHVVICKDDGCNQVIHAQGSATGIVESNGASYANDSRYTRAIRAADFCP